MSNNHTASIEAQRTQVRSEHFPSGTYEWPALLRKLDRMDASYTS